MLAGPVGRRVARSRWPASGSTRGAWTTGCSTRRGALIGNPVHYRDARTDGVTAAGARRRAVRGHRHTAPAVQHDLPARRRGRDPALAAARTLLLIPDLLAYWLTGSAGAEVTNASTTALLDVSTRSWAADLMKKAGIPPGLFPPLRQPGDVIGPVTACGPGLRDMPLIAVGSHDTASAVAAVPADGPELRLHLLRHLVAGRDGAAPRRC